MAFPLIPQMMRWDELDQDSVGIDPQFALLPTQSPLVTLPSRTIFKTWAMSQFLRKKMQRKGNEESILVRSLLCIFLRIAFIYKLIEIISSFHHYFSNKKHDWSPNYIPGDTQESFHWGSWSTPLPGWLPCTISILRWEMRGRIMSCESGMAKGRKLDCITRLPVSSCWKCNWKLSSRV